MGPLFLIAFVYQILGFLFGIIIRETFYVPRNFWQGIIVLCGMSNWGNLRESSTLLNHRRMSSNSSVCLMLRSKCRRVDRDPTSTIQS